MPLTPKEMIKLLKKNGFEEITQNGSHVKMKNQKNGKTVIVPYHSKAMKKGLEQAILKQAGLKQSCPPKSNGGTTYEQIILSGDFSQRR